ncbi:hypothetical protein M407DRAFT_17955 [Tulasnella calospora MUT 4182]|uniref:Uncharacterized protein n=1 Tax=Tulasnella calospora MUT 4182 TaxID=1051891 RepID=A0A0C3QKL5_9AGAM|nr:hypothetical protein M407DRAFT_17955 [Tulasnella calospora MUT 4182]
MSCLCFVGWGYLNSEDQMVGDVEFIGGCLVSGQGLSPPDAFDLPFHHQPPTTQPTLSRRSETILFDNNSLSAGPPPPPWPSLGYLSSPAMA